MADLRFENHGTIVRMTPVSDAGREWIDEHIPEDAMKLGDSVCIEHRYADAIILGAQGDGLICTL
jgi:hypothetical protein